MEISDVRVKLIGEPSDRLKAVCSITLDEVFVVRDLKVVDGTSGLFVAMPSRKLTAHCPRCRNKNHLRARFCNECGSKLPPPRNGGEGEGRTKLHRDIAHPINTEFRELVQERLIQAFHEEVELAKQPGYEPRDLETEGEEFAEQEPVTRREAEPEPEPEPAAEREPEMDSEYEPTEYDALIAGLGRGEGERPQRRPQPQHAQRPPQAQPRRSDDRGRRGGERRDDRGGSQNRGENQDRGRGRERGQGQHQDRPRTSRPAPGGGEQRPRGPRPEPRPEPRQERRPEPMRPVAVAPPPPPPIQAPDETDDIPFGAGL